MAWIVQDRLKMYQPTRKEPYITDSIRKEIVEKYFPRYPRKQAALLPLFHLIMHEYGFIAAQAIDEAAQLLEITPAEVQDAASFYEEFRFEPAASTSSTSAAASLANSAATKNSSTKSSKSSASRISKPPTTISSPSSKSNAWAPANSPPPP